MTPSALAYNDGVKGLDALMKELQPEAMDTIPFGSVDMRLNGKPTDEAFKYEQERF